VLKNITNNIVVRRGMYLPFFEKSKDLVILTYIKGINIIPMGKITSNWGDIPEI